MQLTEQQKSEGWRIVKFGEIAQECKEKVDRENNPFEYYVAGGDMDSESLVIRRWGVFGEDYVGPAFHRVFRKGQILYGSRRTYLKKVAIADFDGVTANTTFVIEPRKDSFLVSGLLPYIMLSNGFTKHSVANSKGSTNPYIVWSDIAKYEFALPPRPRQEEILENIDHFVRYSKSLLSVISESENLLRVFYFDYLKKELNIEISNKSLFDVNCDVKVYKLNELLSVKLQNGLFVKNGNREKEKSYFLNVTDIYKDDLQLKDLEVVTCNKKDLSKYLLEKGDVVFNRSSLTRSGIGWPYIFDGSRDDVTFDCHLIRAKFDQSIILPEYAYMYSLSPWARRYFLSISQTTTMTTIGQDELGFLPIAVPSIEKQRQIHQSYSKIVSVILLYKNEIKKITRMQKKYINRALLGGGA